MYLAKEVCMEKCVREGKHKHSVRELEECISKCMRELLGEQ